MSRCHSSDHFLAVRAISFRETAKGDVPPPSNSVNWVPRTRPTLRQTLWLTLKRASGDSIVSVPAVIFAEPNSLASQQIAQFTGEGDSCGVELVSSTAGACNSDINSARRTATSASNDVTTSIALSREVASPMMRYCVTAKP